MPAVLQAGLHAEKGAAVCLHTARGAWAKYADACFNISWACRSSRTSRSNSLIRAFSAVVWSGRLARPFAAITLGLSDPNAKAIRRTAQLTRDRSQLRRFTLIIIAVFHRQPHCMLAELALTDM